MSTVTLHAPRASATSALPAGELALALQEALTVVVRLRTGRQVAADAASFRIHIKQLLTAADQRARALGYDGESVKLAVYAFIALLDESVLGSSQAMFAEWSRQSLQEEVFGEHLAGENFFRTLQQLLSRQDSDELADVLEVYLLCILLGFRGRYGLGDAAELHALSASVQAKIQRIRGGPPVELAPDWNLPATDVIEQGRDRWLRRLSLIAGGTVLLAVLLYALYSVFLNRQFAQFESLL